MLLIIIRSKRKGPKDHHLHLLKAPIGGLFLHVKVMIVRTKFVFLKVIKMQRFFFQMCQHQSRNFLRVLRRKMRISLFKKINLEKMQFELQTFAQTLKGGMLDRKKSLQGVERIWMLVKVNAKVVQIQQSWIKQDLLSLH